MNRTRSHGVPGSSAAAVGLGGLVVLGISRVSERNACLGQAEDGWGLFQQMPKFLLIVRHVLAATNSYKEKVQGLNDVCFLCCSYTFEFNFFSKCSEQLLLLTTSIIFHRGTNYSKRSASLGLQ